MPIDFTVDDLYDALQKRLDVVKGINTPPQGIGDVANDPLGGIREAIKRRQDVGGMTVPKVAKLPKFGESQW